MKKVKKALSYAMLLSTSLLLGGVLSCIPTVSCNSINLAVETKNKNVDDSLIYFRDYIKETSNNNLPTLDITRAASICTQISLFIHLGNLLVRKESNTLNNFNDANFFFMPSNGFNRENIINHLSSFTNPNFDYNIDNLNSSNIAPLNILAEPNNDGLLRDINNIKKYINKIKQITGSTQIDFSIEEILFKDIVTQALENPKDSVLEYIIKNANKIIVYSEGAWHTKYTVPWLIGLLKDNVLDKTRAINSLEAIKNDTASLDVQTIKDLFQLNSFEINGTPHNDFIHYVHYDASYGENLNYIYTPKKDYNFYNVTSYSTNFTYYGDTLFTKPTIKNEFLSLYSLCFMGNNSFKNMIVNGYNSYDPKKKNLIFIGSSLFKPLNSNSNESRLVHMPNILKYVRKTFDEILAPYNLDEYNVIFKLHPIFKNEQALNYVRLITNNKIKDPIILTPSIPLEVIVSNDYYKYTLNKDNTKTEDNFIFKGNSDEVINHTKFIGFQATTTSFHVLRKFYQYTFGLDKFQAANIISFENFPIPQLFPIVSFLTQDNSSKNYYNDNLKELSSIYKYYNLSELLNDQKLTSYDNFIINNIRTVPFDKTSSNNTALILIITFSIIGVIALSLLIYFLIKKNKNKNKKNS